MARRRDHRRHTRSTNQAAPTKQHPLTNYPSRVDGVVLVVAAATQAANTFALWARQVLTAAAAPARLSPPLNNCGLPPCCKGSVQLPA